MENKEIATIVYFRGEYFEDVMVSNGQPSVLSNSKGDENTTIPD